TLQAEPTEQYDVVRVDYPVDLRLAAECVDSPVEELVDLNPSLVRRTTPKDQSFDLHLPSGTREKYEAAIAAIPKDKRVAWRYPGRNREKISHDRTRDCPGEWPDGQ